MPTISRDGINWYKIGDDKLMSILLDNPDFDCWIEVEPNLHVTLKTLREWRKPDKPDSLYGIPIVYTET